MCLLIKASSTASRFESPNIDQIDAILSYSATYASWLEADEDKIKDITDLD